MALFDTVKVTLALSTLHIKKADDRWGGVEPYVVPVFYKVDGERYLATLRILNSLQPRPGTTEVVAGNIQFSVDTVSDTSDPRDENAHIQEDNPLTYVPPGNLLGRGDGFDSGDNVDVSDVSFTTKLIPIPFKIDVLGLPDADIIDALQGLSVVIQGEVESALNMVFLSLNHLIAELVGLDEKLETCPAGDLGSSEFISNIEAQFKCMIPGTVGGVFLCMENDEFGESLAQDVLTSLQDEVKAVLNDTINAIALNNPIPDPELWQDEHAMADNISSDLTWPVVSSVGLSIGAIVLGTISLNPFLVVYGLISSIGWAIGGPDDAIGQFSCSYDHRTLLNPDALKFENAEIKGDDNVWQLSGGVTVNT